MMKLTLEIDGIKTVWENQETNGDFQELLEAFLGLMWSHSFVPGTEIRVFEEHIAENKPLYTIPNGDKCLCANTSENTGCEGDCTED